MPEIALPAIGVVFLAVFAALLLFATPAFTKLLQATIGRLPFVGGYIAGILTTTFQVAAGGLMGWAQSAVGAAATLVYGITSAVWALPASVVDSLGSTVAAVNRVSNRLTGNVLSLLGNIAAAERVAASALAAASGALQRSINAVAAGAAATAAAVASHAAAALASAVTSLERAVAAGEAAAAAALSSALGAAYSAIAATARTLETAIANTANTAAADLKSAEAAAAADLGAAVTGVERYAQTVAAAASATLARELDQAAHDLVIGPWAALLPDLKVIVEHLPAEATQALPGLETIPETLPVSLPLVLSILSTAVAAVTAETSTCTVPMCENLGGLSGLLNLLEGGAIWAALVALVAEAAHDPGAAVSGLVDGVAPVINATARDVKTLVGV